MREKFKAYGRDIFHTHELLEMILFHAVPRRNTNVLAKNLIERFSSLDGVLCASREELEAVRGVGPKVADMLVGIGRISFSESETGSSSSENCRNAISFFTDYFKSNGTCGAAILLLDNKMGLICCDAICNTDFAADAQPFIDAALKARASVAVIANNRPLGPLTTKEDIAAIYRALGNAGVPLLEYYAVSGNSFVGLISNSDIKFFARTSVDNKALTDLLSAVSKEPKITADKLLFRHGSLVGVAEADVDCLNETVGDMTTSIYIKLAVALISRRNSERFRFGKKHTDDEIREYLKALFFGLSNETVYLISLDGSDRVIACERVGEGSVNISNVIPRKLLETAKRRGASRVILAHNHPGGCALPSEEDKSATQFLRELFISSGIDFVCHYTVAGFRCSKA